jgi:ATP-binding cassette subfamily B protein
MIGQLNSPIEQMVGFVQSWQNAKISMDRLNEVHALKDEEPADSEFMYELPPGFVKQVSGGRGTENNTILLDDHGSIIHDHVHVPAPDEPGITFGHVSFVYPGAGNEPVLKDIHLKIPRGKVTAIVGVSGSGKTTLLKLLLKFYEVQKGEIKIDHTPLNIISHKTWRIHCGVVMQESFIFSDTIAKNIAVGVEKPDMQKLREVAAIANAREFIESLPLGYNTKIGMEGTGISMGQKQRILIARAVYRDPAFIFFDEATNSLDANNESLILDNLQSFFKGRTVVVVAHRLSTVKNADQIIVLNKGTIVERGTHQELVNLKGEYFTLVKNQLDLGV